MSSFRIWGYGQFPDALVPVTVTVTRFVRDPLIKSTSTGEKMEPVLALKVTVFGMAPAEGLTIKPLPPPELALNVPLPVTETLPEEPHAIVSVVGETVNEGVGVTESPFGPCTAVSVVVSTVRPVASETINATVPQPVIVAVNLPPRVLTMFGDTVATLVMGDATL